MKKSIFKSIFIMGFISNFSLANSFDSYDESPGFGDGQMQLTKDQSYQYGSNKKVKPITNFIYEKNSNVGKTLPTMMPEYGYKSKLSKRQQQNIAFDEYVEEINPFTPIQYRKLNGIADENAKARQETTLTPPKPVKGFATVSFNVNTDIPVVSLDKNNVTTMIFTDENNYKWEILSAKVGDEKRFQAYEPIQGVQTNMLSLTTGALSGITNLTVLLKDAPAPLIFTLITGGRKVDYTFNVKVKNEGPNTPKREEFRPIKTGIAFEDHEDFKLMKQGVIPKGIRVLRVRGNTNGLIEAYASRDGKHVYLRTNMKLIAPAYTSGGRLLNGELVYEIPRTEVVSFMHEGRNVDVTLSNFPMSTYSH